MHGDLSIFIPTSHQAVTYLPFAPVVGKNGSVKQKLPYYPTQK